MLQQVNLKMRKESLEETVDERCGWCGKELKIPKKIFDKIKKWRQEKNGRLTNGLYHPDCPIFRSYHIFPLNYEFFVSITEGFYCNVICHNLSHED